MKHNLSSTTRVALLERALTRLLAAMKTFAVMVGHAAEFERIPAVIDARALIARTQGEPS